MALGQRQMKEEGFVGHVGEVGDGTVDCPELGRSLFSESLLLLLLSSICGHQELSNGRLAAPQTTRYKCIVARSIDI